jgi:hypothetical protein
LEGAKREYEVSISKCPNCWEATVAKQQLDWIVPAIAAKQNPQEQERLQAVYGEEIDYPTFFAKIHTGLPIGKRYNFKATITHALCIMSDSTTDSHLFCGARANFDNQAEYENLLRGTDNASGTIVASMGADGIINIHSFH